MPGLIPAKQAWKDDGEGKGKKGGQGGDGKLQGPCFDWAKRGECSKGEAKCPYTHYPADRGAGIKEGDSKGKGKGKGKNDKSGKGKGTQSDPSKGGGDAKTRTDSQGRPAKAAILDHSKLCQNYLAGKCTLGRACTLHHNEPCKFLKAGNCKNAKCPFPHWNVKVAAVQPPAPASGGGGAGG